MGRCTDDTCKEIDNNAILDVSPNSKEDPLTWFKVSQLPMEAYESLQWKPMEALW